MGDSSCSSIKVAGTRLASSIVDEEDSSRRLQPDAEDGSVLIEHQGWYALFAGPFSFKGKVNDDDDQTLNGTLHGCGYDIQLVSGDGNKKSTFPLPQVFDNRALTDPHVGKAIYASEPKTTARLCTRTTENSRHHSECPDIPWYLYKLEDNAVGKPPSNATPKRKKFLVCHDCLRSFTNWDAIRSHRREKHPKAKRRKLTDHGTVNDPWDTPLKVVFQDSHIAIIDKPQNMAVHGTKPSLLRSDLLMDLALSEQEAATLRQEHSIQALRKPRPAHRLDAATGGILVVVKTVESERIVKNALADRKCSKKYLALLVGKLEASNIGGDGKASIETPIQGKEAITDYKVVRHVESLDKIVFTLVDLWPQTGRNHQLRRHMKALGHPIVGDTRYGRAPEDENLSQCMKRVHSRLCLWAVSICLDHPFTNETRSFSIEDPKRLHDTVALIQKSSLGPSTKTAKE